MSETKPTANPMEGLNATLGKLMEKMDPGDFAKVAKSMAGLEALQQKFEALDQRTRLINIKLTLLLEDAGFDHWKEDPRVKELKK